MLAMQSPQNPTGFSSRMGLSFDSENTGFSHSTFVPNMSAQQYGNGRYATRNVSGPTIDTATSKMQSMGLNDTPATGYDMNFTPLLPSQLLLGSPFQPGSATGFGAPTYTVPDRFSNGTNLLQQQTQQYQQSQQTQNPYLDSPNQLQTHAMSPTAYNTALSPDVFLPQSPPSFSGLGGAAFGSYQPTFNVGPNWLLGTSRTVYLGNIPSDTTAEELLSHVRSGQIESVRILNDKNCAFISFLDGSSATHFHSDAILKKLTVKGHDIKIGWGKPSSVPTSVALAVQQSSASRNVYLGNLPDEITDQEIREDLGKFGAIDTVKMVREKNIAFVHFLSIGNAIKAVSQLPQDPKWQPPRRVYYGKDRCAYVSKTQQQNAAQYLGIAPGYAHVLNGADRDLISNALAQQSVAAAAVATTAGGVNNLGNRTIYLGNIHPETTLEEICNVVRGGLLHHIRYIPDKHICFVTFIDPTSAASFYALSNLQGLMIHNRRLKIGWGKHSGALPPAIALAVSGGASRNVYIGNLDEGWSEERLRQDFSEYGEIELVNALREKSCAFVNFTNIANAIKAIEGMRQRDEYKRFKINFGKDRCGNPPRQPANNAQTQDRGFAGVDNAGSPAIINGYSNGVSQNGSSPTRSVLSPGLMTAGGLQTARSQASGASGTTPSAILNAGGNNPLTMYLSQVSQQQYQTNDFQDDSLKFAGLTQHQSHGLTAPQISNYRDMPNGHNSMISGSSHVPRQNSISGAFAGISNKGTATTVGGLLAPTNTGISAARSAHSRAVSLPAFSPEHYGVSQAPQNTSSTASRAFGGHASQGSFGGFGSAFGTGYGTSGFSGLGLNNDGSGWGDEVIGAR